MEYVESEKVSVAFRMDSIPSEYKSEQAGHPVFEEVPFITIVIPGSQNQVIDTKVDETHRRRFATQFQRFMQGLTAEGVSGWKLESWPAINTAQVKTLKYFGVHTVEQLADLSDTSAQAVGMGTMELRTKARAAVKAAGNTAQAEQMAAELKRRDDELADLKAQFAAFAAEHKAPEARKPGRPRNEPSADRPAGG